MVILTLWIQGFVELHSIYILENNITTININMGKWYSQNKIDTGMLENKFKISVY